MISNLINKLLTWYGKKTVISVAVIAAILLIFGLNKLSDTSDTLDTETKENLPTVELVSASSLQEQTSLSLIGNVRSASEVDIIPERSGRVTRVNTTLGAKVSAGQVLVELENASERAALLQAQGAYEAAKAAALQSGIGSNEAQIRLEDVIRSIESTSKNSYSTSFDILVNTIDDYFANPNSSYPSLRLSTGNTEELQQERIRLQTSLVNWRDYSYANTSTQVWYEHISLAKSELQSMLGIVDSLIEAVNADRNSSKYTGATLATANDELISARNRLVSGIGSLEGLSLALRTAEEGVEKAKISAAGGEVSVSEAQLKQALGVLRAAEANYAKTIIKTPIAGTVNSFDIKLGQQLNSGATIAKIANNNSLEIVTFVSESERKMINVGDKVNIDNTAEGTIVVISPALDQNTRKIEVRISSNDPALANGKTVRISTSHDSTDQLIALVRVPLTAVKLIGEEAFMYTVENDTLVKKAVTLGEISGDSVTITSGFDADTLFVKDVRGKNEGDQVRAQAN